MYDIVSHARGRRRLGLADFHLKRMVLSPFQWNACRLPLNLNWTAVKFNRRNRRHIPTNSSGVYTFLVQPGIANHPCCSYLLYVGETETQNFRTRYGQYLRDKRAGDASLRPHVTEMLQKWDGFLWFCYAEINTPNLIEDLENALLTAYLPPTNKDFPAKVSRAMRRIFGT
jgi:hypothetical protein